MPSDLFGVSGRVAVVTGGYGVLGGSMAGALADAGARVAVLGRRRDAAEAGADALRARGGQALALVADVTDRARLLQARRRLFEAWGRVDLLINAAGGNRPQATVAPDQRVFDVPPEAFHDVTALNLYGTVLPSLVFGEAMAEQGVGCIVNISSIAAERALTRVAGYGAAKAAVDSFTRWMAVEMAQKYGEGVRVNAIRPGFFIAEQNQDLLLQADGSPTERGATILRNTPMGRFGRPEELHGALLWLCSDAASFVTGAVIPIDGGFGAFSGV